MGGDNLWSTATNWMPSNVPTGADNVIIPPRRGILLIDGNQAVGSLTIESTPADASLTLISMRSAASLRVFNDLTIGEGSRLSGPLSSLLIFDGGLAHTFTTADAPELPPILLESGSITVNGDLNLLPNAPLLMSSSFGRATFTGAVNASLNYSNLIGDLTIGTARDQILLINNDIRIESPNATPNITFNAQVQVIAGTASVPSIIIDSGTVSTAGSGGRVSLNSLGTSTNPLAEVAVTAEEIVLTGSVFSERQSYATASASGGSTLHDGGTHIELEAPASFDTGSGFGRSMSFNDLYIRTNNLNTSITMRHSGNSIRVNNFVFYQGRMDIAGQTLEVANDFVLLGTRYSVDDAERSPGTNEWEYPRLADLVRNPGAGSYNAEFSSVNAARIRLTGSRSNFYVNGSLLQNSVNPASTADWFLSLPANTSENSDYLAPHEASGGPWGIPYAIVLNSEVRNSRVLSNSIIAANAVTTSTDGVVSVTNSGSNSVLNYNTVILQPSAPNFESIARTNILADQQDDGSGGYGYDFVRTRLTSAETVKHDVLRLSFNKYILNSALDICNATAQVEAGQTQASSSQRGSRQAFAANTVYLNSTIRSSAATVCAEGDNSYYALRQFYIQLGTVGGRQIATWRTDAVGSDNLDAGSLNGGLGDAESTDAFGRNTGESFGNVIPDVNFEKGTFRGSNGADLVIADGLENDNHFNNTTDATGPVLYQVRVGRYAATGNETDSHNYLRLLYSEPLAFGDTDGASSASSALSGLRHNDGGASTSYIAADSANNFSQSQTSGGEIRHVATGTNAAVEVAGLFSYTNSQYAANADYHMRKGSSNASDPDIDLIRKPARTELEVVLAARQDSSNNWIGWTFSVLDPYGADNDSIRVLDNAGISDLTGNTIDSNESTFVLHSTNRTLNLLGVNADGSPRGTVITDFTPDSEGTSSVTLDFWDVSSPGISSHTSRNLPHPDFARDRQNIADFYEIILSDANNNNLLDTLNIFIQDNALSRPWDFVQGEDNVQVPGSWNIAGAANHSSATRLVKNANMADVQVPRGIRDLQLQNTSAFRIYEANQRISATPTLPQGFSTQVDTAEFSGSSINIANDGYFSLSIDETQNNWTAQNQLYVTYNAADARITDLAGNLMPSSGYTPDTVFTAFPSDRPIPARFSQNPYDDASMESGKLYALGGIPPEISLTLSSVGGDRVYVEFSEPVYGSRDLSQSISAANFLYSHGTLRDIQVIRETNNASTQGSLVQGVIAVQLLLSESDAMDGINAESYRLGELFTSTAGVWDASGNNFVIPQSGSGRRISDVLIGVVTPVFARSNLEDSVLRTFDGSGSLSLGEISIESNVLEEFSTGSAPRLYFDANVADSSRLRAGLWLPEAVPALISTANSEARQVPGSAAGNNFVFTLSEEDSELTGGNEIEFVYQLGDRFAVPPPAPLSSISPETLDAWSFVLGSGVVQQRGGVSITNNVINPRSASAFERESTLFYRLSRAGQVIIQVFTLDGDTVLRTVRSEGAGDRQWAWNGRNSQGRVVAPGFYIVRLVAAGIDTTRKILVVQ